MNFSDTASLPESAFTFATSSTVWGPGAVTGKFLKAFGEMSLDVIMNALIRRRLPGVKRMFSKQHEVFLGLRARKELHDMSRNLRELCRSCYPRGIRETATTLLPDIGVYQILANARHTLETTPRILIDPQNQQQADKVYQDLKELSEKGYSESAQITASYLARSVGHLIIQVSTVGMENETALRWIDLAHSLLHGPPLFVHAVITETITTSGDIQIGKLSEFREPDCRARSVIIEENARRQYHPASIF